MNEEKNDDRIEFPVHLEMLDRTIVRTESTAWMFDGTGRYQRLPLAESGPRGRPDCGDSALDDGAWIEYRDCWIERHPYAPGAVRIRVIPSHRFEGSEGVASGVVVGCIGEIAGFVMDVVVQVAVEQLQQTARASGLMPPGE